MSGWLVIRIRAKPASRSLRHASRTPASTRSSARVDGGCGFPSRRIARFNTPSRSRKTARRIMSEPSRAGVLEHGVHGDAQGLLGRPATSPPQAANTVCVEADHRYVAFPTPVSACVIDLDFFIGEPGH